MEKYWEIKIKRQMVPKSGKSFVFFFPKLGNFLESQWEKNVTETRKFWEIKMEHIFLPVLEIKCIFSQNMGNYMKTIVDGFPITGNQCFYFLLFVFNFILKIFCSSCRRSSAKKQDMLGK
jgi:hypothetical protein